MSCAGVRSCGIPLRAFCTAPPLFFTGARGISASHCGARSARRTHTTMVSDADSALRGVGRFSVAPMMEVTDRHFRVLARLISTRATLWTEMVVDRTIIHNETARGYELPLPPGPAEPTVLQLGGSEPELLAQATALAASHGYTEINLNCGCPSPRVAGRGAFGAALMRDPPAVAGMIARMAAALPDGTPVSIKCRLGVDEQDEYKYAYDFVSAVSTAAPVRHFIIHARKAILAGLSPKQNREVPPLRHDYVYRLIDDFPHLRFTLNGGVRDIDAAVIALEKGAAGVMLGRAVRERPWIALCDVDARIYGAPRVVSRRSVLAKYCDYADTQEADGCPTRVLVRPLLNLFSGEPRGKMFRRVCDERLRDTHLGTRGVIEGAIEVLHDSILDALPPSVTSRGMDLLNMSVNVPDRPLSAHASVLLS